MALASERPTTEGTVDSAGPLDTTMVIWAPLGWGVSAGGSVRMTWPSGTDAEDSVVWVTVKPFWPRMFDASVTLRPATFGTPRSSGPLDTNSTIYEPRGASRPGPGCWRSVAKTPEPTPLM